MIKDTQEKKEPSFPRSLESRQCLRDSRLRGNDDWYYWRQICGFNCLAFVLFLSSCMPWAAVTSESVGPVGNTSNGVLVNATEMQKEGFGYSFYHKRDRRYGTLALAGLVERVSQKVSTAYPGSVLKVGDISGAGGGKIMGHSSHRTGLDVDFAFFVRNPAKENTSTFLLALHDANGLAVADKEVGYFDMEKNWAVVEALLTDDQVPVQWIFISKGLKARLLSYALNRQKDLAIIEKAASVLHQPGDSAIHNDHFHVRIFCPEFASAPACEQRKPIWPWIERPQTKSDLRHYSDERLVQLALEGL